MKKFLFLAACVVALAFFATSCYQSVVTPIGDDLATFTQQVGQTEYLGVKNMTDDAVIVQPSYTEIRYKMGYVVAIKSGGIDIYKPDGEKVFTNVGNIEKVRFGESYFIIESSNGKYFFVPDGKLCGPASDFKYEPKYKLLFVKSAGGNFGAYDPVTGKVILEPKYSDLVYALDEKGNTAFYTGSKVVKRISNGVEKTVTKANFNAMVKEAEQNKTPWPKTEVGIVKVKALR